MRDLDRLLDWSRWRPSLCQGCWAGCCRLPAEASGADLVRLGLATEDEVESSPKRLARRLIAAGLVDQYRATTGKFTLARTPGGDCLYLDANRRCKVYERRPEVCRQFPVTMGPRPGYCPAGPKSTCDGSMAARPATGPGGRSNSSVTGASPVTRSQPC